MALRTIIFRGKRKDNGEWVEGYYAGYSLICPSEPEDTYNATGDYYGMTPYVGFVEVDPETVGQYTGLTDKKGNKIFEGDIIKITWVAREREPVSHVASVTYRKSGFFTDKDGRLKGQLSNYICDDPQMTTEGIFVEVIGTIHDNPELLKDGE